MWEGKIDDNYFQIFSCFAHWSSANFHIIPAHLTLMHTSGSWLCKGSVRYLRKWGMQVCILECLRDNSLGVGSRVLTNYYHLFFTTHLNLKMISANVLIHSFINLLSVDNLEMSFSRFDQELEWMTKNKWEIRSFEGKND